MKRLVDWFLGQTITKATYEDNVLVLTLGDGTSAFINSEKITIETVKDEAWDDPLNSHPLADVLYDVSYAPAGTRAASRRKALEEIEKYCESKNASR